MDRIESDLYELCTDFLLLLIRLKKTGKISKSEYELHTEFKKLYIHQVKSKLSV